jgi:hypothetical protein
VIVSSSVTVGIPDVVRGPGQSVHVPVSSIGLPLRLTSGGSVTTVRLTLHYNPALLTISAAAVTDSVPIGATVTLDTTTPGQVVISFSSPTPLAGGTIDLITLTASVPNSAPYAAKQVLDLRAVMVNGNPAHDDDGIHLVAYPGDVSGNAGYSALDATQALRRAVGLGTGFDAYPLADPVLIADIDGNGRINATDATRLLQHALGINQPAIPPLPANPPTIPQSGPDPFLNIPTHFTAAPGEVLTVPVNLDLSDGLEAADLVIAYDTSRLDVLSTSDVTRGTLTEDFDLFAVNLDREAGTIRVGLGRSAGAVDGRGSGSVLHLIFQVRADAPAGPAIINLRQGLEQTRTQLNEGGLDLIPDPSDEAGDVLDGQITVLRKARGGRQDLRWLWGQVAEALPGTIHLHIPLHARVPRHVVDLAFALLDSAGGRGRQNR